MPLIYDAGQLAIAQEARRALEAQVRTEALLELLEQTGAYDEAYWRLAREQGWAAATLPESFGGLGLSLVELGLIAFQTGRVLAGAPFLTSGFGVGRAIAALAPDSFKQEWLPRLASGEAIGAVAFAEGQAVLGLEACFEQGAVSGTKHGVSGGLHADIALVLAQGAGEAVLVVAPLASISRNAIASFDNSRCLADLTFGNTPAMVLATGNAAMAAARDVLAAQAVVTAHEQAGGAEALMERARDYANARCAFGQPIGAFQSVKHRIAELYVLVELARATALSAAASEGSADFLVAAAAARLQASEAYDTSARDCVQIHGGMGVTWEAGLHLHVRRARSLAIEQGNMLFWEDLLVDELEGQKA